MILLHMSTQTRARAIAEHVRPAHSTPLPDDLLTTSALVRDFLDTIRALAAIFTSGLICVFEGRMYEMKGATAQRRRVARQAALEAGKHKEAMCVPDCLVRMIMKALRELGIKFIVAPREADAQVALLQASGVYDHNEW
jgi:hypothetical protein